MKYAIDETELARLEALAGKASTLPFEDMAADGWGYVVVDILPAVTAAVPALVAEVRRLRENLNIFIDEDQSRVILLQQQMLDCMRGKVEAFEWAWEVNDVVDDLIFSLREDAVKELQATWNAAREAVHADRE